MDPVVRHMDTPHFLRDVCFDLYSFRAIGFFQFYKRNSLRRDWRHGLECFRACFGATIAFLIGRYIARDKISGYFEHNQKFQLIDHAIHQKGWKVILLARLTPIFPFLIANYGFGLTKLKARHYFLASLIGSIPGTAVFAYAGSLAGNLSSSGLSKETHAPAEWVLLFGGLIATVTLGWYLNRLARRALQ